MLRETSHAERGRAWAKMEQSGRMPRIFAYLGRLGGLAVLALLLAAGSARADYQSGLTAFDAGDFRKAAAEWQASAEQGDARSQHGLGLLYDSGRGFPENPKLAAEWYSKAAAQGVTAAASNLALLYATGRGVQKNLPKAVQLWDFAAKGGYATAQFNLGLLYYRGDGVAKSYPTAAAWFLKAAQGGSDDGAYAVAEMYRLGRGVPKDTKKAIFWFSQSARNGNTAAADRLAVLGAPAVAPAPAQTASAAAVAAPAAVAPPPAAPAPATPPASGQAVGTNMNLVAPNLLAPSAAPSSVATATPPSSVAPPPSTAPKPLKSMPNSQVTAMAAASPANSSSNTAISLGLPLAPDAPASAAPAGPAHVWIGTLRSDNDARLYWMQEVRRFPDLLQRLSMALRPVDLGAGQGVWFKVLAGPFAGADAAGKICQAIRTRAPADDCSVVTD